MKILSIIVPSYNTGAFVDECVPTFVDAGLFDLVDVFFIDDGATDDTKERLEPYIREHSDYFHFVHKENGGHGSVINYALNNCVHTKYFKVIDGDDHIDPKAMCALASFLAQCDDDLVVSGYAERYPNRQNVIEPIESGLEDAFLEGYSYGLEILPHLNVTIHSATFKSEVFQKNHITLPEKVFFEDNLYILYATPYLKRISFIKVCVYYYRLGNPTQSVSLAGVTKHYDDAMKVRRLAFEFYDLHESEFHPGAKEFYIKQLARCLSMYRSTIPYYKDNKQAREKCLELHRNDARYPQLLSELKKYKFYRLLFAANFRFIGAFRKIEMRNMKK